MDCLQVSERRAKPRSRRVKQNKRLSPSNGKQPVITVVDIFDITKEVFVDNDDVTIDDFIEEDYELDDEDHVFEYTSLYERNNNGFQKSSSSFGGGSRNVPGIVQHRQQLLNPHKWKHLVKKQDAIVANRSAAKQNIEKQLQRKGLHRQGPAVFEKAWSDKVESQSCSKRKSKSRYSSRDPASNSDSPAVLKHALNKSDVQKQLHLLVIVDMQHRDITPEDYELLLQLDNDVAPKTVSQELLNKLETATPSKFGLTGELCSVCMERFVEEDLLKKLLCGHCFHSACVDQWLTYSSCACPLDGLPVVQ